MAAFRGSTARPMIFRGPLRLAVVITCVVSLTAACGNSGASATRPVSPGATNVAVTASPSPSTARPSSFACPAQAGVCLGPLVAGTYTTRAFSPSIQYTVPEGWTNGEDLLGNFLLQLRGDQRYLGIYRNVRAPLRCEEKPDPEVNDSIEALSAWLTSHPGLTTTEPKSVEVGGLEVCISTSGSPERGPRPVPTARVSRSSPSSWEAVPRA